ncbi:DHA2 family efflux MFS transporter permease subunit, partial [Streptomyces sp. SPB074]|uniref:DHA2 family efflux MFS transporter permease subunit n=1 Tax=Streptomyces sp. (strain SPB074) TaxID=465543 RepID=UPI0001D1DEBD
MGDLPRQAPAPAAAPERRPVPVRWALLGVLLALLLSILDGLIVGTAMPTIVDDLGGLDRMSWVVTGYILATACSTAVWGKLGDLLDRKRVFLASVVLFLAASAACGLAPSMNALIAFRVVQGLGAGGMGAGGFALIGALVPPRERGRYQGMIAAVMALGQLGGPLLGGFVTGHFGWRWAFYVNVPLGLVSLAWCGLLLRLPARARPGAVRIDWGGIVLLGGALSALVLAATWAGSTYAWTSWRVLGLGALAVTLLAGFVVTELRVPEPLMPPRVYTGHRNFPLAAVVLAVTGMTLFGTTLYLPLHQQVVRGATAAHSGLLLLPMMLATLLAAGVAGKVMSATGRYKLFPVVGAASMIAGMGLLSRAGTDTPPSLTTVAMVLLGAGSGFALQMANTIAQNAVAARDLGAASAAANLFRTLGGSLGLAVFASLFTSRVRGGPATGPRYAAHVAEATQAIFLVGACAGVAALLAALAIEEVPLGGAETAEPRARGAGEGA